MYKILFLLKKREFLPSKTMEDWRSTKGSRSSGLFNSARAVAKMIPNSLVLEVVDANCIDREVTLYKPRIVILEALWVTPTKLQELVKLHPKIQWFVRLHSEVPFLAIEGVAMGWLKSFCLIPNVHIASNSTRCANELQKTFGHKIFYLPNYYELTECNRVESKDKDHIDISCFGAIRPMKNHLLQAVAAIKFANHLGKNLHFHINATRREDNGDPVLNNLRSLFHLSRHKLIEHPWMDHDAFVNVVSSMDIGMQVSLSETFNIVTADHINQNVPMVTSDEIKLVCPLFRANATSFKSIVRRLHLTWHLRCIKIHALNRLKMRIANIKSKRIWNRFVRSLL